MGHPHHQRLAIVKPDPTAEPHGPTSELPSLDGVVLVTLMCVVDALVQHCARLESRMRALEAQ